MTVRTDTPAGYFALTRTATYSVLAALPLFVLYEVLVRLTAGPMGVRVGADVWVKRVLEAVGVNGTLPLLVVALVVAALLVVRERRQRGPVPLVPRYFAGMLGESAAYAVVSGFAVAQVVGALLGQMGAQGIGLGAQLALSLGAGLYEELVFRVLLVGGLAMLLRRLWRVPARTDPAAPGAASRPSSGPVGAVADSLAAMEALAGTPTPSVQPAVPGRRRAYVVAALVGALIFSAVHYIGAFGDPFMLSSFTFRFLLGLVFNGLYLTRGFGVAAWTHALYDVFVTLMQA